MNRRSDCFLAKQMDSEPFPRMGTLPSFTDFTLQVLNSVLNTRYFSLHKPQPLSTAITQHEHMPKSYTKDLVTVWERMQSLTAVKTSATAPCLGMEKW